ncbi:MAG: hypothetical protein AB7S50_04000 [Bacteroidales bacterium]
MLKHQILISFVIIAVTVWIAFKIRDKRRRDNEEDDDSTLENE